MPGLARYRLPLCPRCHRPVTWDALACPHCSHLLDPEDESGPPPWERRRDTDGHRGRLIDGLGTACLLCGFLVLCTAGVSALGALGTGIPALVMAGHDLERMRRKELDEDGRSVTELGRNKAVVGLVLAVVFTVFFVIMYMEIGLR